MTKLAVAVSTKDHRQGDKDAPCTLVEYGDYQCPSCGQAYPIVKRVQKHFGKRLSFVFRNFPLTQLHPYAESAAETAEFAGAHEKFWEMHDLLFENQDRLGADLFAELATQLGLDPGEMYRALAKKTFTDRVRADVGGGIRSGVNGTPTFYINGQRYDRPMDYATMVNAIDESIAS